MHMLSLKKDDSTKEMAVFWITGLIKFAILKYEDIKKWTIKVDCESRIFDGLRNYLKTVGVLGRD